MKRSLIASFPTVTRRILVAVASMVLGLSLGAGTSAVTGVQAAAEDHSAHEHASMSPETMRSKVDQWFASHPVRGRDQVPVAGGFAATFTASGSTFDEDGAVITGPDTAKIFVGETVLWQWIDSIHTVTNGENTLDPAAGTVFNVPLDSSSPTFTFTFNSTGVFPFFCQPHEIELMKGYVLVQEVTGVTPIGRTTGTLGFVTSPSPNPSRGGFMFRFALATPGRVKADAFDASGRRVASVFDRTLEPGSYAASWDGRTGAGAPARPGTYFLRLRGPGFDDSRKAVIER